MKLNPFLASIVLSFLFLAPLSAAESLPLPDTVQFTESAALPIGVKEHTLKCAIVSEDSNVLVVETSTVPGVNARISIDKSLIAEVKKGDPSLRPFAEIAPDLLLPAEARDPAYYDDKIDRVFRPFLKKFPQSSRAQEVRDAEKAYAEEFQRVTNGEFRVGKRWTQKSLLTPVDVLTIKLIQQARQDGESMSLFNFKKLTDESRTCFASEFFPLLGETLDQVSAARIAKLKASATAENKVEEKVSAEHEAMLPVSGWNWDHLNQAVALVGESETMLKSNPPEQIAVPLDLIKQSQKLMPFLLARERIIRQQAAAYAEKAAEEDRAANRSKALAWWHASLQLAAQLPPPDDVKATDDILMALEKSMMEQAAIAVERRQFLEAKAWLESLRELMTKTPGARNRLADVESRMSDFNGVLQKHLNQQTIDDLRKALADFLVKGDFENAKFTLATRWANIKKLSPTTEETTVFAHAALDQSLVAFKSLHLISGCQLLKLAKEISPEDARVKTYILTTAMTALATFLVLLFPLFWVFARGTMILENLRYKLRLKSIRKKAPKKGPEPGKRK